MVIYKVFLQTNLFIKCVSMSILFDCYVSGLLEHTSYAFYKVSAGFGIL